LFQPLVNIFLPDTERDKTLRKSVSSIIGEKPNNLSLYRLAFIHTSVGKSIHQNGFRESNERLEYLGDAVLGMVIAEYLFKKFPYKDEGFLTDIRSRIVNRESLNNLAKRLGINDLIEFENNRKTVMSRTSMYGDAMEALIGAIYIDKGFRFARQFIIKKLLSSYFDLDSLIQTNTNYKSLLIEWAQKEGKKINWLMTEEGVFQNKEFTAIIQINEDTEPISVGNGHSKKKAEQDAARKACELLELS
jgi:ribonuclease III